MKMSSTITRNRIAATLRWIGLAALDNAGTQKMTPAQTLARFEAIARKAARRGVRRK
jgi:hypothetical protein